MIRRLGVRIPHRRGLGENLVLTDLQANFDAIFLSRRVWAPRLLLDIPGEEHVLDGLDYIEQSKLDSSNFMSAATWP